MQRPRRLLAVLLVAGLLALVLLAPSSGAMTSQTTGSSDDSPVCAPLLIATKFDTFPYVFAGINYSCIPPEAWPVLDLVRELLEI